ncbi:MAG: hypothetical protein U9N59_16815 [Campylobacterota bacterium]|nr:hypothetical protein [Campylobacterota bacterium]
MKNMIIRTIAGTVVITTVSMADGDIGTFSPINYVTSNYSKVIDFFSTEQEKIIKRQEELKVKIQTAHDSLDAADTLLKVNVELIKYFQSTYQSCLKGQSKAVVLIDAQCEDYKSRYDSKKSMKYCQDAKGHLNSLIQNCFSSSDDALELSVKLNGILKQIKEKLDIAMDNLKVADVVITTELEDKLEALDKAKRNSPALQNKGAIEALIAKLNKKS